tara:strand:- start:313 stop:675 length:363 start_codon:yes stop_codon:yes gene_type:complete
MDQESSGTVDRKKSRHREAAEEVIEESYKSSFGAAQSQENEPSQKRRKVEKQSKDHIINTYLRDPGPDIMDTDLRDPVPDIMDTDDLDANFLLRKVRSRSPDLVSEPTPKRRKRSRRKVA